MVSSPPDVRLCAIINIRFRVGSDGVICLCRLSSSPRGGLDCEWLEIISIQGFCNLIWSSECRSFGQLPTKVQPSPRRSGTTSSSTLLSPLICVILSSYISIELDPGPDTPRRWSIFSSSSLTSNCSALLDLSRHSHGYRTRALRQILLWSCLCCTASCTNSSLQFRKWSNQFHRLWSKSLLAMGIPSRLYIFVLCPWRCRIHEPVD